MKQKTAATVWPYIVAEASVLGATAAQLRVLDKLREASYSELVSSELRDTECLCGVNLEPTSEILTVLIRQSRDGADVINGRFVRIEIEPDGYSSLKTHDQRAVTGAQL